MHNTRNVTVCMAVVTLLATTACGNRPKTQSVSSGQPSETSPTNKEKLSSVRQFTDITAAAGISYKWEIPGKRPMNLLQTIGNGCAFLDYDGDGNLDILLVGSKLALYRGDGHGHFTDVTHTVGLDTLSGHFLGCAVADYDNDGWPDIYISGYQTGLLLHNEKGIGFKDVTAQSSLKPQPWGTSCAWGDVDGDGILDLYVCNYVQFGPNTVPQLCEIGGHMTACSPLAYQPLFGVLYQNRGNGRFEDVTRKLGAKVSGKGLGVAFGPLETKTVAAAIANDEMPGDLLVNAKGHLSNIGPESGIGYTADGKPQGGMGIDWGDYDNDGKLDVAVATFENEAKPVYKNEGNMRFEDQSQRLRIAGSTKPFVAFGLKWFDFDNDGWLDLIISNGHTSNNVAEYDQVHTYRQPTQLFHNNQGTQFAETSIPTGKGSSKMLVGRGLAVGDIDNDGLQDVLIVDSEGSPVLLRNTTSSAGHWLLVKLIGTKSNRDGIGAVITAETAKGKITRHCHTDGSYLSSSDPRVHLGLGSESRAKISITWPNGHVDVYSDVAADRQLVIREGSATIETPTQKSH
jgi:hypothetical protein